MNKEYTKDLVEFVEQFLHEQVEEAIDEYFMNGRMLMPDRDVFKLEKLAYHNMIVNINVTIKE